METRTGNEFGGNDTNNLNNKTNEVDKNITSLHAEESILFCNIKPEIQNMNLLSDQQENKAQFSGVFCKGVQYFDLKNIDFISNNDIANLIDLLKSLLKQGIGLQLVNVNKKIKEKVKAVGLDRILNCT